MSSWFNDNQRIGIILSSLGGLFTFLGVLFLFDRGLLAIGNDVCSLADTPQLLFLSGVALVIGLQKTFNLFFQIRKLRGTIPFFFGIGLVLIGWTKIGILVEGFGFVNLFGNFFPPALAIMRRLPIIGALLRLPPGLDRIIERIVNSGRTSNA